MVTAQKVKESEITEQDSLLQVTAQKVKESEKNMLASSSATAEVEMTELLDSPSSETDEEEETRNRLSILIHQHARLPRNTLSLVIKSAEALPERSRRILQEHQTVWTTVLTLVVLIAGGSYAAPISIHALYPVLDADQGKIVHLSMHDLFTYPSDIVDGCDIVDGFLFFTTITIAYISAMIVMLVAVCMICRKREWGTSLSVFAFFVITTMLVSFCSTLNKLNPRVVRIDGVNVEFAGGYVSVFYSVYVIIIAGIVALIFRGIRGAL